MLAAGCVPLWHAESPEGSRGEVRWGYVDATGNSWKGVCPAGEKPWLAVSTNDGVLTLYDYEGHKSTQVSLRNGLEDGAWISWRNDGTKKGEGKYSRGLPDGNWTYWGRDGERSEEQWENGKPHGCWTRWSGTQEVMLVTGKWPDGSERCETVRRYKEPVKESETVYDHGRLISRKTNANKAVERD